MLPLRGTRRGSHVGAPRVKEAGPFNGSNTTDKCPVEDLCSLPKRWARQCFPPPELGEPVACPTVTGRLAPPEIGAMPVPILMDRSLVRVVLPGEPSSRSTAPVPPVVLLPLGALRSAVQLPWEQ